MAIFASREETDSEFALYSEKPQSRSLAPWRTGPPWHRYERLCLLANTKKATRGKRGVIWGLLWNAQGKRLSERESSP